MGARDLTEAERLELAGYIAPALRCVKADTAQRRVKLVNKDGEVTGEATLGDALKGLAKIHELEHAVADGQRPKEVACQLCGKPVSVAKKASRLPKACRDGCDRQKTCATDGCEAVPSKKAFQLNRIKSRGGALWRCKACARRERELQMTPEQRLEATRPMRERLRLRSSEQFSESARKRAAAMTPEQRSEAGRKGMRTRLLATTPEQRSASARKTWATRRARKQAAEGES